MVTNEIAADISKMCNYVRVILKACDNGVLLLIYRYIRWNKNKA